MGGQNVRGHNFLGHRHQIEEGVNAEGVLCLFHDLGLRAAAGGPSSASAWTSGDHFAAIRDQVMSYDDVYPLCEYFVKFFVCGHRLQEPTHCEVEGPLSGPGVGVTHAGCQEVRQTQDTAGRCGTILRCTIQQW